MRGSLRTTSWSLIVALSVVGTARVTAAQTDPSSGDGERSTARPARAGRQGPPAGMTLQQVEQYFDQIVLNQARTRLNLGDAQFFRFGGALRRLQTVRRQQQRQRLELIRELGQLSASGSASDDAIAAKTRELDDFVSESFKQLQEARDGVDAVLDVRQRAQFRVFEEMMERRKLDLLTRARRAADPARGQAPGP